MTHLDVAKATATGLFLALCGIAGYLAAGLIYFPT